MFDVILEVLKGRHGQHDLDLKKLIDQSQMQIEEIRSLNRKVDKLMSTEQDLVTALNTANSQLQTIGAQVVKIGGETSGLVTQVGTLQTQVGTLTDELANQNLSPEAEAALAAVQGTVTDLGTKVQAVDDMVPDVPVPVVQPPATDPNAPTP